MKGIKNLEEMKPFSFPINYQLSSEDTPFPQYMMQLRQQSTSSCLDHHQNGNDSSFLKRMKISMSLPFLWEWREQNQWYNLLLLDLSSGITSGQFGCHKGSWGMNLDQPHARQTS